MKRWGRWTLDKDALALSLAEGTQDEYEVDLERCTKSAEVLDWIMQVAGKTGVSEEDLGYLVRAINDLLRPQATMCGAGKDKTIDPRAVLG